MFRFLLLFTLAAAADDVAPTASHVHDPVTVLASVRTAAPGLRAEVLDAALDAHACASSAGHLADAAHPERVAIIDFSLPSAEPRLWVVQADTGRVLFHERVAHGQGTGGDLATAFSNRHGSHQSSLGVFRTAEPYVGKHGRSLRLDGLEPGTNDAARSRAVVLHGADYATEAFVEAHGRLGRSWGCPAVRPDVVDELVDALSGGALLVAWYPDEAWLSSSPLLTCDAP